MSSVSDRSTRSTRRRAVTSAVVAVTAVAGLTVAGAPAASAAKPTITVTDGVLAQTGQPTGYMVLGTGIPKKTPVTVEWGDGTAQVVKTTCSTKRAKVRPKKCKVRVGHVYSNPGTYAVTATRAGTVVSTGTVQVVGETITEDPKTKTPTTTATSEWRSRMLKRVNTVRSENGAGPVTSCDRLNRVAQDYAGVMAMLGHYGHTGPTGESPWDRMEAGGYYFAAAGENIAMGYTSAADVQEGWERSVGHFRNMINPDVTNAGFGAAMSTTGTWYWVQVYGAPRWGYDVTCDMPSGGPLNDEAPL